MAEELSIEILKQIRDNTALTNERLDQTNQRLDQTNERLDQTNERLGRVETRLGRVEQGVLDLGKFMRQIALDLAKQERWHDAHVKILEKDVARLSSRVTRLEKKKGA